MMNEMKLVFLGVGAIGGSVGGWVAQRHEEIWFLARGAALDALRRNGLTLYQRDEPERRERIGVRAVEDLSDVPDADVVVLAVKNYGLEDAARSVREKLGEGPVIVSMANGVENQEVLPKYFPRVIYCVVNYNAWVDEPGVIGFQRKGPLVLGALGGGLQAEVHKIAGVFNLGVQTHVTDRIRDAAHCKLVLNLNNALLTLIGFKYSEVSDISLFQKLLTNTTYEGILVIRAAGIREFKLESLPSWRTLALAARIPQALTAPLFERNLRNMGLNSMAQDVLQRGRTDTELESLNGYIVGLAEKHGVDVPYNRAVCELARREFKKPGFRPMDVRDVWNKVAEYIKEG